MPKGTARIKAFKDKAKERRLRTSVKARASRLASDHRSRGIAGAPAKGSGTDINIAYYNKVKGLKGDKTATESTNKTGVKKTPKQGEIGVEGYENHTFKHSNNNNEFQVYEAKTGGVVGRGKTLAEAQKNAKLTIDRVGGSKALDAAIVAKGGRPSAPKIESSGKFDFNLRQSKLTTDFANVSARNYQKPGGGKNDFFESIEQMGSIQKQAGLGRSPKMADVISKKGAIIAKVGPEKYNRILMNSYQDHSFRSASIKDKFMGAIVKGKGMYQTKSDKAFSTMVDGITDSKGYVTVYRGLTSKPQGPGGYSWTPSFGISNHFASQGVGKGYNMQTKVKRSDIYELGFYAGGGTEAEIFLPKGVKVKDFSWVEYTPPEG